MPEEDQNHFIDLCEDRDPYVDLIIAYGELKTQTALGLERLQDDDEGVEITRRLVNRIKHNPIYKESPGRFTVVNSTLDEVSAIL